MKPARLKNHCAPPNNLKPPHPTTHRPLQIVPPVGSASGTRPPGSWFRCILRGGLETCGSSQRLHSPLCCSSSSSSSGAQQICSNPCIVWAKPHIKFALHKPFHWAAAGIPLLGHSSVYMVWTHIWNKASQSRIILRKLHTFQDLQHMSLLFHALFGTRVISADSCSGNTVGL